MSRKRPAGIGTGGAGLEHRKDKRGLCEAGRKPGPQGVPLWDQRSCVTALPGKGLEAKQQILPLPSVSLQVPTFAELSKHLQGLPVSPLPKSPQEHSHIERRTGL